jgi:hypothetical protein
MGLEKTASVPIPSVGFRKKCQPRKHCFFLKQISNTRASGRGPVRRADATDDLISLKLHFEFTAPYVFNREVDTTIAFSARFDGLSHERISSRVVWI